jgi:hypothetical protein
MKSVTLKNKKELSGALKKKKENESENKKENKRESKRESKSKKESEEPKGTSWHNREDRLIRAKTQAATINHGVIVRLSNILEAGNGLFAARLFKKGEIITAFGGKIIDYKEALGLRAKNRSGYIAPHMYGISAILSPTVPVNGEGGGQFANHKSKGVNAKLIVIEDKYGIERWPFLIATKLINIGDEIFYSYGTGAFHTDHS